MIRTGIFAAAAVLALSGASFAADLPQQEEAAAPVSTGSLDIYVQVMGGLNLTTEDGHGPADGEGWLGGATIGISTPIQGVSLEIDFLTGSAQQQQGGNVSAVNASTVMANAVYTADLTDSLSAYVGAGAGLASVDSDDSVSAFQAFGGVQYSLTESIALTLEARYQASFEQDNNEGFNRTAILGGLLFSF